MKRSCAWIALILLAVPAVGHAAGKASRAEIEAFAQQLRVHRTNQTVVERHLKRAGIPAAIVTNRAGLSVYVDRTHVNKAYRATKHLFTPESRASVPLYAVPSGILKRGGSRMAITWLGE